MATEIMEIDGGTLEGGGQILRMAMAFSALLKKPIKVCNIRAGRSKPGLRPQHLAGLQLVRDLSNGCLVGGAIGSTEITFHPGTITAGKYSADPGTAGSIMLLFQVSFPCLLFADGPSELYFRGGTNAEMAPQIDHTLLVFKPIVENLGAKFTCDILKRGYFPKGGGEVIIKVTPIKGRLMPVNMIDPGPVVELEGRSFVAGVLPLKVAHDMAEVASRRLRETFQGVPRKIERVKEPSHMAEGNGSGIVLVAKTEAGCLIGGSALGKRGVRAEEVSEQAIKEVLESIEGKACVDSHMQDQLIIFMALAKGKSRLRIGKLTLHTKTAIFVAELMTEARFTISHDEAQHCTIECEGIGLMRNNDM